MVALSLLGDALLYAVLPARAESFQVLVWQVGLLLGANRLIRLITNELAGRLIQRARSDRLLILAVIIGSLTTASYALPWGFWGLLAARLIWGSSWSILRVEGYVSALEYATDKNRGRILGIFQALTRAISGGGVLLGGILSDVLGIGYTFVLFSFLSAAGFVLVLKAPARRAAPVGPPQDQRPGMFTIFALAFWTAGLLITMSDQMISNLTGRLVVDRILPHLSLHLGAASLAGILLSVRSIGTMVVSPATGVLSDRLGKRRILLITLLAQVVVILLLPIVHGAMLIALLLFEFILAVAGRLALIALAGELAPIDRRAMYMSRFTTFTDLGTALGPMIGFSLYARAGLLPVAVLAVICIASGAGLILYSHRRR